MPNQSAKFKGCMFKRSLDINQTKLEKFFMLKDTVTLTLTLLTV